MRENAATKGRRLLVEGRLRVLEVDEYAGVAMGEVRGDSSGIYIVFRDERGWRCDCPAKTTCSHIVALQLVTCVEPREPS